MIVSVRLMLTAITWAMVDAGIMNLTPCSPSVHGVVTSRDSVAGCTSRKRADVRSHHSEDGRTLLLDPNIATTSRPFGRSRLRWPMPSSSGFDRAMPPYTVHAAAAAATAAATTKQRRRRVFGRPIAAVTAARLVMCTRPNDELARVVVNVLGYVVQLKLRSRPTPPPPPSSIVYSCTACTVRPETRRPLCSTTEMHTQPPSTTLSMCTTTTTCAPSTCTTNTCAPSTCTTTTCAPSTRTTTTCAWTTRANTWWRTSTPSSTSPNGCSNFSKTWRKPIQSNRVSLTPFSVPPPSLIQETRYPYQVQRPRLQDSDEQNSDRPVRDDGN